MNKHLLPTSSSELEKKLAEALQQAVRLPVPLRTLWNEKTCPALLLPYLAWALSVDRWDEDWSEESKRKVIAQSFDIHRKKGTIAALRQAIEPFGYLIEVVEWFEKTPQGVPGTFSLRVGVLNEGITNEMYQEVVRLIEDVKPVSRQMVGLDISLETRGTWFEACANYSGEVTTIYPYVEKTVISTGKQYIGIGLHIIDEIRI